MYASHVRKGQIILYQDVPHRVLDFQHRTPGNLRAFVQMKLRNLMSGASIGVRFSATESVERAILEQHEMQYLYSDPDHHHFMNTENYEQITLDDEALGSGKDYLVPDMRIVVEYYDGQPIGVDLPSTVDLEVTDTEPEMQGATASASYKPATLETGVVVQVPPFIKIGDKVRINPNDGTYQERVKE